MKTIKANHEKNNHLSKMNQFFVVLTLFTKYYIKSFLGPFFNFVFAPLIYAILGTIMGYQIMLPGVMAMVGVSIGIQLIPFSIMGLKKSVILKRIGASPVKPAMFTGVMCFFFLLVVILSSVWLTLWALIISGDPSIYQSLKTVKGFFGYTYGLLLNIAMSITLGFLITSFSKSEMHAQALGLLIFFPIAFLSGQFISPEVIAQNDIMQWISRFIPFRYTTMMMTEAWTGDIEIPNILSSEANIWKIHEYVIFKPGEFTLDELNQILSGTPTQISAIIQEKLDHAKLVLYDKPDHIISFVYPYVTTAIFLVIGIKFFSWSSSR